MKNELNYVVNIKLKKIEININNYNCHSQQRYLYKIITNFRIR